MERWPGHERQEKVQASDRLDDKGKRKDPRPESSFWRWPHLEYGAIGRITLTSKGGRVQWSSAVDASHRARRMTSSSPVKVFPETRSPQISIQGRSTRQRAEKGLQYLRAYFPDADFPGELIGSALEADDMEMRGLKGFDPLLGNLLEIMPSHHAQNESIVVFPMGELGRELNISRFFSESSGNMVFVPAGSSSFVFETPILQISSTVGPSEWTATPYHTLLIRTHASSSLFRLEHSKFTRELDITRSEVGDVPIVDSRILASGPDIVAVNQDGKVYKCNTYQGGKAMQLIGAHEVSTDDDFWQLGTTERNDECFFASRKAVKHVDLRSASSFSDLFSLDHPSAIVTSFESPMHDSISRITTTTDLIWLDDRFRSRPLLSYKHYRSFDRTLRSLTANFYGASFSLLTSRRNALVTLYDVNRNSDGLLHCNSVPSCLPHDRSVSTTFDGHALAALHSNKGLTFLRLCQRGGIYRQDIRVARPDEDQPEAGHENHVAYQWGEDVQTLAKQASELQTDFGPAGGRHYTEVNLRGAYENIFAIEDHPQEDMDGNAFEDTMARLPEIWKDTGESAENMLTTFDVISGVEDGAKHAARASFLSGRNLNAKQAFGGLMHGHLPIHKLVDLAPWHYNIQDTSIPTLNCNPGDYSALHERLKGLNLESGAKRHDTSVRRETEARECLILDLALSNDVYSAVPIKQPPPFAAGEAGRSVMTPMEISYSEEPPEIEFGYFGPVRKAGADHYANNGQDGEREPSVSSPLGVRLLLAEWELGTDPKDYAYRDPYGVVDVDAQPIPQYRRLPTALPTMQKKQTQPHRPPLVTAAVTQPPVVHPVERMPALAVHQTHSQQQFEPGLVASSQEPMTSTQVLPGPFGGRPGVGKKPGKKRIGGF